MTDAYIGARGTRQVEVPDIGVMLEVPSDWGQEQVDRRIREFQAWYPEHIKGNGSGVPEPTPYEYRDRNASDDPWYMQGVYNPLAYLRGTGQSLATVGDILSTVPTTLANDVRAMTGAFGPPTNYSAPVSKAYDAVIPQMPKGYETAETLGEITGPALVEAAVSGRPRGIPYRFGRDVALGIGGGEVGGEIASRVGGEEYRDLGRLFGGAVGAVGVPATLRRSTSKILSEAGGETPRRLETIDRLNRDLTGAGRPEIPPSVGLIGNKAASTLEDITGRTIFSQDAARARRQQITGIEAATEDALQKARGRPSAGPITPETIGRGAESAISTAEGRITQRIQKIQNDLENQIDPKSPVGLKNAVDELTDIVSRPKEYSLAIRQQAADLRAQILQNRVMTPQHPIPPYTGKRPKAPQQVTPGTAGYGAIKDVRSSLGRTLDKNQQPLAKAVQERGYTGLTKDMEEAAAAQGVSPEDFAAAQAETKRLYGQREEVGKLEGKTEGATHSRTAGAKGVEHLDPLLEHTPDEALTMLVDDLELKLRRGNAGGPVDPTTFDTRALEHWRTLDPRRKQIITGGNSQIARQLDDAADVATMEEIRGGRRTRPGVTGSTMGASLNYGLPALMTGIKGLAAGAATLGIPKIVGKMMTSPGFARMVAKPGMSVGDILSRAVGGATAGANVKETPEERLKKRQQGEEDQFMKGLLGIK